MLLFVKASEMKWLHQDPVPLSETRQGATVTRASGASGPCGHLKLAKCTLRQPQRTAHGPEARVAVTVAAITVFCIALVLTSSLAIAADSPSKVESSEQLQQLFDHGLYSELLAKLTPAIAAKSSAADKPARYAFLMLKGQALLRTKASDSAIDAFKAAALIGPDDHSVAMARAMTALIKHSSLNKYQPKTKTEGSSTLPPAIDILEATSRKQAFAALFTDLFDSATPQVERAEKLTTLPPIEEAAKPLADLRPVELAGSDSDARSKALLKKLGEHASTLMTTAMKNLDSQTSAISKEAARRQKQAGIKIRGIAGSTTEKNLPQDLTADNVDQLNSIITQAGAIGSAAVTMQTTFGDAANFKAIETTAGKTIDTANKLLKQYDHASTN